MGDNGLSDSPEPFLSGSGDPGLRHSDIQLGDLSIRQGILDGVPRSNGSGMVRTSTQELRESVQPLQRAATMALRKTTTTLKSAQGGAGDRESRTERRVKLNGGLFCPNAKYTNNSVKTSKYNIITFLPVFLFEMFSRVAYLYFLLQAGLSWWTVVSPTGGMGSTLALLFVLVVAAVKAIAEDMKRHREDKNTNDSSTNIMKPDGSLEKIRWRDVKVGNIVKVFDDENIPADLLCLHSELVDNVCFVKTTNLDGESNLKIRRPLQLRELVKVVQDLGPGGLVHIKGVLQCEHPTADLHNFKGRFSWIDDNNKANLLPVTMNEILLRGTLLKNSGAVYGLVVYTGEETRIQMNNAKVPFKNGAYNKFLNLQISLVGLMQISICLFFAIMAYAWKSVEGVKRYYMAFDINIEGNYENPVVYVVINFFTFWILESYMVPISLFVSVEIVKFWQGFVFINMDPGMVDKQSGETARCRNSNLMEDLGKIDYIFSDKTGTLTSNDMRLRQVAVKGVVYGKKDVELENVAPHDDPETAMGMFDPNLLLCMKQFRKLSSWGRWAKSGGSSKLGLKMGSSHRLALEVANGSAVKLQIDYPVEEDPITPATTPFESDAGPVMDGNADEHTLVKSLNGLNGLHLVDFWTNICVCHSLIIEKNEDTGERSVQGPSPDEVALVNCAKQIGFDFIGRDASNIYLDMQGERIQFEVLNVLEFSSDRRRMSVIARSPDGTIRLFVKGADSAILGLLNEEETDPRLLEETDRNLHLFAQQGLRTLCLATKVLSEEEYRVWDAQYQDAAASLDDRDSRVSAVAEKIEQSLDFVGITAIEDKLQDGVPESIATFLDAGIRVWMITGDKRETAINIAVSCRLLHKPEEAFMCEAESVLEAAQVLDELLARASLPAGEDLASTQKRVSRVLTREPTGKNDHKACTRPSTSGELVIDGRTLSHILGTDLEEKLAELGSLCASVVVCRASPSQKASIVKMMRAYELDQAAAGAKGVTKWLRHLWRDINSKMLAIGDGANDVAMIQAADVGVGIMGKEGRQAVNNSDYAFGQFKFLTRLLLVHGQLSDYRIAYLIKYSFYKNICFAAVLTAYQFFNGYSGTTVIDDISAFMYNVVFTSMPIMCFAMFDRTMSDTMLLMYPRTYNSGNYLNNTNFWKTGIFQGILDGCTIFFIPFLGTDSFDIIQLEDVASFGKTVFIAMLGTVTLEVALASRFWTNCLIFFLAFSYFVVYPYIFGYSAYLRLTGVHDHLQNGVGEHIMQNPNFWFSIVIVNICTTGHRILLFCVMWAFFPSDTTVLSERERIYGAFYDVGWQTINRLQKIGVAVPEKDMPPSAQRFSKVQSEPLGHIVGPGDDSSQPVVQHRAPSGTSGVVPPLSPPLDLATPKAGKTPMSSAKSMQ